jgi:hypothetical protein
MSDTRDTSKVPNDRPVFRVLLTPARDSDPSSAHRRLARVLKALGRAHGFVNLGVALEPPPAAQTPPSPSKPTEEEPPR